MKPFSYLRPTSVEETVAALSADKAAQIIAGGTNLVDLMKYDVTAPSAVIDIGGLDLRDITRGADGTLHLGALATNADTAYHPEVRAHFPLLSSAILAGASPQLRNAATNGGNLHQRTRCYYFYDPATPCNKRNPGSGCGAIDGVNRIHAILGTSPNCIATHPSDMCVALAAMDAVVHVTGPSGKRDVLFRDFHRLPDGHPERDNTLAPGEMVTGLSVPPAPFGKHHTYLKLRDRQSYAFALVSVAVGLKIDGNRIADLAVALGGVAHKPWRRRDVEKNAIGQPLEEATFQRLADGLLEGARGFGHNDFKIELAHRAIIRALEQAAAGTPQSQSSKVVF
jgi:xanthine dehydrogenase YagS FAD-binding subunit